MSLLACCKEAGINCTLLIDINSIPGLKQERSCLSSSGYSSSEDMCTDFNTTVVRSGKSNSIALSPTLPPSKVNSRVNILFVNVSPGVLFWELGWFIVFFNTYCHGNFEGGAARAAGATGTGVAGGAMGATGGCTGTTGGTGTMGGTGPSFISGPTDTKLLFGATDGRCSDGVWVTTDMYSGARESGTKQKNWRTGGGRGGGARVGRQEFNTKVVLV